MGGDGKFGIHHAVMISQAFIIIVTLFVGISVLLMNGRPFFCACDIAISAWTKLLFLLLVVAAIFLGIRRETYLPFLGPAVIPPEVIKDISSPDGASVMVNVAVDAPDGTKIIYWAATEGKAVAGGATAGEVIANPWIAYTGFKNAGVALVKTGKATLKLNCPSEYRVGSKKLQKHVHYRICKANGMAGPVETSYVTC